jgi:arginase
VVSLADWVLLGAPWDCSGTGRGEAVAPGALRAAGLGALVGRDAGDAHTPIDGTDRDPHTGVRASAATVRAARALAGALDRAGADGRRPLVVGGDCSLLLGVVPSLRRRLGPIGLWFVDGHPDYLDGHGSDTGETADMDLAILTGVGAQPLVSLAGAVPMVAPGDAVLIGHRGVGLDETSAAELARAPSALRRVDAEAVRRDPGSAGRAAAALLGAHPTGAWLHIDLDVLDPDALPAVTYPQPGGPDWDQLGILLGPLASASGLLGVSVADFRPDLDPTGAYAARVVALLDHLLA